MFDYCNDYKLVEINFTSGIIRWLRENNIYPKKNRNVDASASTF